MSITIGRINNHRAALAFCDYLRVKGILAKVKQETEETYLILIAREADEDYACAELRDFLANPNDPKYLAASWTGGETAANTGSSGKRSFDPSQLKQFLTRSGPVTRTLAGISILLTLLTGFGSQYELTRYFMIADIMNYQGSLVEIMHGQLWRLFTPIFLHFMLIHLLFNMMWFWDLGGAVERIQSSGFMLFFVLSSGLLSNLIQYLASGPAFGGMSGVVYALLGSTWIRSTQKGSGYRLNQSIVLFMLGWLALGFTGWIGPIGNAAHLSGLIIGMAYAFVWNINAKP